jgi:hypothetical protein
VFEKVGVHCSTERAWIAAGFPGDADTLTAIIENTLSAP